MSIGFKPVRGNWVVREFNTASAATFGIFCPVTFDGARNLIELGSASGQTAVLGISLQRSADSFPAGKVQVAIPADNTAVFRTTVQTGVAASALSIGEVYNIEKSGNTFRLDADSQASGRIVIVGPVDSATSQVDCSFLGNFLAMPSNASLVVY